MNCLNNIWLKVKKWFGCKEKESTPTYQMASLALLQNICHHIDVADDKFSNFDDYEARINEVVTFEKKD